MRRGELEGLRRLPAGWRLVTTTTTQTLSRPQAERPHLADDEQLTVLLTGAAGFVGSAALEFLLRETKWTIVCPVTYRHRGEGGRINSAIVRAASSGARVATRVRIVYHDLMLPILSGTRDDIGDIDIVWNIASQSHVDRSLELPATFIRNNVELMLNLLEFCREARPAIVLHMSTDEVFGPAGNDYAHHEWDSIRPSNPYAASKAAQEAIAYSYWRSFNVPLVLTNTMNLLGVAQHHEKFVPKTLRALREGKPVTIHATPEGTSGSRFWIDVRDFVRDWLTLTTHFIGDEALTYYPTFAEAPHRFNLVGEEASNLEVAQTLAEILDAPHAQFDMVDFHTSRPGHDVRYALDGSKYNEWHKAVMGDLPHRTPLYETLFDIVAYDAMYNPTHD